MTTVIIAQALGAEYDSNGQVVSNRGLWTDEHLAFVQTALRGATRADFTKLIGNYPLIIQLARWCGSQHIIITGVDPYLVEDIYDRSVPFGYSVEAVARDKAAPKQVVAVPMVMCLDLANLFEEGSQGYLAITARYDAEAPFTDVLEEWDPLIILTLIRRTGMPYGGVGSKWIRENKELIMPELVKRVTRAVGERGRYSMPHIPYRPLPPSSPTFPEQD